MLNILKNTSGQLRNGWWMALFFALLALTLLPLIFWAKQHNTEIPLLWQAVAVLLVSILCQRLRGRPQAELLGAFNWLWPQQLGYGLALGAILMAVPALLLSLSGLVQFRFQPEHSASLGTAALLFAAVAITEELTFRGFLFQRLIDGIGSWPAQLAMAAYFVLNHSATLHYEAAPGVWQWHYLALVNIFCASLLFGLAYIRTGSLALPIGLHWMANWLQGAVLGFGVSGSEQSGLFSPLMLPGSPDWLTGGSFGLEASVPGLLTLVCMLYVFWRWPGVPTAAPLHQSAV